MRVSSSTFSSGCQPVSTQISNAIHHLSVIQAIGSFRTSILSLPPPVTQMPLTTTDNVSKRATTTKPATFSVILVFRNDTVCLQTSFFRLDCQVHPHFASLKTSFFLFLSASAVRLYYRDVTCLQAVVLKPGNTVSPLGHLVEILSGCAADHGESYD